MLAGDAGDAEEALRYYESAAADYSSAAELGHPDGAQRAGEVQRAVLALNPPSVVKELLRFLQVDLSSGQMDLFSEIQESMEFLTQEEYIELYKSLEDATVFCEGEDGKVLVFYPSGYCYYGQWKDGMRSGYGWYLWGVPTGSRVGWELAESSVWAIGGMFEGYWENDLPNGTGTEWIASYSDKGDGPVARMLQEERSFFKDGLYHGEVYLAWYYEDPDSGTINKTAFEPYTAVDGVIRTEGHMEDGYFVLHAEDDGYSLTFGSDLTTVKRVRGV